MAIKKVSTKQAQKNRELARIKRSLAPFCFICGRQGNDLMHLLPKLRYPEHYLNPLNLVIGCRSCHNSYDNDLLFRKQQTEIFERICEFDEQGAINYFRL